MKKLLLSFSLCLVVAACTYGQLQIDRQLQMTGSTPSDRQIKNLGDPTTPGDAVNARNVQNGALVYATDSGSTNTYVVTLTPAPASYNPGMTIYFKAANACTGASTLNVNGLGQKSIRKLGNLNLSTGDIAGSQVIAVVYDGTNFQMIGGGGASGGGNLIFTMSLSSSTASLDPVNTTSSPLTITLTFVSGTTAGVGFNITGVPLGITYSLTPGGCFPSCSAALTFSGTLYNSGSFPLTLTATGGGYTQTASLTLNVSGTVITLGPNGGTVSAANPFGGPNGAVRLLEVPAGVTSMTIEAYGAQGGGNQGGLGARMKGTFSVTPGQMLKIAVGQKGVSANSRGGGGGGSFVTDNSNNPLIIAGGGGGSDNGCGNPVGLQGVTSTSGTSYGSPMDGGGGSNGGGGGGGQQGSGGGGGGFIGNGGNGQACQYGGTPGAGGNGTNGGNATGGGTCVATGGLSFINGATGGIEPVSNINGGYGGGGSAYSWNCGGGGGGGYSGGGGGGYNSLQQPGGGGGSYNGGTNQSNSSGVQSGNGQIVFTW